MANIDKINEYNEGTLWPFNYEDTYIAAKHVQNLPLVLVDDLVSKLENAVEDAGLFFDDGDLLKEIAAGLIKGNVILQGPPGTGKTTLAAIICDVFNVKYDVITAVSDWTTYDTIGGLQPSVDDEGNEIIVGKNGRIVESIINCCNTVLEKEHHDGEKQASWLVVDELNRCEIDKVFGDLFTVFGSDDLDKRKLPLWFENDKNKQILYVPRRFRIIGLMNNVDKNYVFDLSRGLARRFTIVNVLPPGQDSFNDEIKNCKKILEKKLPKKIKNFGSAKIDESYVHALLSEKYLMDEEKALIELLKQIRYDSKDSWLGLQYGTAQIIDLYENILIHMILDNYQSLKDEDKTNKIQHIIDAAVNDRILPQLDGYDYMKLKKFDESFSNQSIFSWMVKCKKTINTLV